MKNCENKLFQSMEKKRRMLEKRSRVEIMIKNGSRILFRLALMEYLTKW